MLCDFDTRANFFYKIDKDNYIVNPCNKKNIPDLWLLAADWLVEKLKYYFNKRLLSILLRGSVARGYPINHRSDLDVITIVTKHLNEDTKAMKTSNILFNMHFDYINGMENMILTESELFSKNHTNTRNLLKISGLTYYGKNYITCFEKCMLGYDSFFHLYNIIDEIDGLLIKLNNMKASENTLSFMSNKSIWILKRILRSYMEFISLKEKKFTRDLYPCYKYLIQSFPSLDISIYEIFLGANYPSCEKKNTLIEALRIIKKFFLVMFGI